MIPNKPTDETLSDGSALPPDGGAAAGDDQVMIQLPRAQLAQFTDVMNQILSALQAAGDKADQDIQGAKQDQGGPDPLAGFADELNRK